jgi:hypothetical protein
MVIFHRYVSLPEGIDMLLVDLFCSHVWGSQIHFCPTKRMESSSEFVGSPSFRNHQLSDTKSRNLGSSVWGSKPKVLKPRCLHLHHARPFLGRMITNLISRVINHLVIILLVHIPTFGCLFANFLQSWPSKNSLEIHIVCKNSLFGVPCQYKCHVTPINQSLTGNKTSICVATFYGSKKKCIRQQRTPSDEPSPVGPWEPSHQWLNFKVPTPRYLVYKCP